MPSIMPSPQPTTKDAAMHKMTVSSTHIHTAEFCRCANVKCKVICEPPVSIVEFQIGCDKHLYRMPFCVKCMKKLDKVGNEMAMEVVE